MSEERSDGVPESHGMPPSDPELAPISASSPPVQRRTGAGRRASLGLAVLLAVLLAVVVAGVLLSPFWAPVVGPILPWGTKPAVGYKEFVALAARVTALEQRPAAPVVNIDAIKSAQAALAQRVGGLEAAADGLRQNQVAAAGAKTGVAQLAQRLDAIDAQSASRIAAETAGAQKNQQELSRLGQLATDLSERLGQLERQVQAQGSIDRNGTALTLALLRMREAVEEGRPFPAEYSAFEGLTHDRSELTAAAASLAGAAREGVASRAALRQRLADLAAQIATPKQAAPAQSGWWSNALGRMRGLVTIRRIDGGSKSGPKAAVAAAQSALASGDVAAAVSALDPLTGAHAEAARPWREMARQRLAAETALTHLQQLLTAQLGAAPKPPPAAAPAVAPAPGPASPQPSATPRAPS